jgi:hypothetical protein
MFNLKFLHPIRFLALGLLLLAFLLPSHNSASRINGRQLLPAYIARGNQVAQRYGAYGKRLAKYYVALATALKEVDPEFLAYLQPRRPVQHGYQSLPAITSDIAGETSIHQSMGYSWPWTNHLIDNELQELARAEAKLQLAKSNLEQNKKSLRNLALDYQRLARQYRNIDAHIEYNHLWQAAITADRPGYDRETMLYNEVVERQQIDDRLRRLRSAFERSSITYNAPLRLAEVSSNLRSRAALLSQRIDSALDKPRMPDFVRAENAGEAWIIHVPLFTDIEDHDFVKAAQQIIESTWKVSDGKTSYRVELEIIFVSGEVLYADSEKPVHGQKLDLRDHLRRFPTGGAILTTGAATTYVLDRAIVLGPQSVTRQLLAHEFGHLLGFRDRYIRGYKDWGENGFLVMETIADPKDIMSATPRGAVLPSHFLRMLGHDRNVEKPIVIPASKSMEPKQSRSRT